MNNEPVAECCDDGEGGVYYKTLANKAPIGKLYAHPAKTLTNTDVFERIEFLKSYGVAAEFLVVYEKALRWAVHKIIRKDSK